MREFELFESSSVQQRLFTIHQMEGETTAYNIPVAMQIEGGVEHRRLEQALRQLSERHEALRTCFRLQKGEVLQKIFAQVECTLPYTEWEHGDPGDFLSGWVRPFSLTEPPLWRAELVRIAPERYLFLFDIHHIISDAFSNMILFRDLMQLYFGLSLPSLETQYVDYAIWQNDLAGSEAMRQMEAYWVNQFEGEIPVLQLPGDYIRPKVMDYRGGYHRFDIGEAAAKRLHQWADQQGATMNMLLMALYAVLLSKYAGQEDLVIGMPVSGRPDPALDGVVGMFVNTLPVRVRPQAEKSFAEFFAGLRETLLRAYDNQYYDLELLVQRLRIARDPGRNPLFDVLFAYQGADMMMDAQLPGIRCSSYDLPFQLTKFDLALTVEERGGRLACTMNYWTGLFAEATMERMGRHFIRLAEAVAAGPSRRLAELDMLSSAEAETLLVTWNHTRVDFPREKSVIQVFEAVADAVPDAAACAGESVFADSGTAAGMLPRPHERQMLTYSELNVKANQLARRLRRMGVERNTAVGLMVPRSVEMIIGIMGILKAGGAYLPIDPAYPAERIRYMLDECESPVLLTVGSLKGDWNGNRPVILLDDLSLYQGDGENVPPVNQPEDLLYIIYTSGTTGKPKGVMIDHRSVLNLITGLYERVYARFPGQLRVTLLAAYVFDASVQQIFGALLQGHSLWIVPEEARLDGARLLAFYREAAIDISDGTPAHLSMLVQAMEPGEPLPVKHFIIGGEALSRQLVVDFLALCAEPGPEITNIYGPAECCVDATAFLVTGDSLPLLPTVPIGTPLANKTVYVLDRNGKCLPVGVGGELYIGGEGVGHGYLGDRELTAAKFLPDPFASSGGRMYKTGDLVRRLPDGNLEFLGRMDHQVKIRGYRIELDDIVAKLLEHPDISEAVVLDRTDEAGEKYLCAYLAAPAEMTGQTAREHLIEKLPVYMVPAHYLILDQLPLTVNGKIDRRRLLEMEAVPVTAKEYVAPRTKLETRIAGLWQAVLHVEQVGVRDHFFEIGGHSLKAMVLASRLQKELHRQVTVKDLFTYPTIEELARFLTRAEESAFHAIDPAEPRDYYPLSSAQRRMFVLQHLTPESVNYNMPFMVYMNGPLDMERFTAVLHRLTGRHEALRTAFITVDDIPVQKVHDTVEVCFHTADLRVMALREAKPLEEVLPREIHKFVQPFDIGRAPLFRAGLLQLAEMQYVLIFDMHHIIADGLSVEILFGEFAALYSGKDLPPLRIQYKDFAVWQNDVMGAERMQKEEAFWLRQFADTVPVLNLPADKPRPAVMEFAGDQVTAYVDRELTERLRKVSSRTGSTMFMTMMAAFVTLLARYSGDSDLVIGTAAAGRPHSDLEPIMGMFVNVLALRCQPAGEKLFTDLLNEVRESMLSALEHQNYPFEMLVDRLGVARDLSRNPLFDVTFNHSTGAVSSMEEMWMEDIRVTRYPWGSGAVKFDLTLSVRESESGMALEFSYRTNLFHRATIERMTGHLLRLLEELAENPARRLADLRFLSEEERNRLLYEFNDSAFPIPSGMTYHRLFEEQAGRTPEHTAVVFMDRRLTYRELNAAANRVARYLKTHGVGSSQIVGVMVDPSVEMMIGVLGVMKSGAAYLPIDPDYPKNRIRYMLQDSNAQWLLVRQDAPLNPDFAGEILYLNEQGPAGIEPDIARSEAAAAMPDSAGNEADGEAFSAFPEDQAGPRDLAYIIYTSGSTGLPKGVMIEHHSLVNIATWYAERYGINERDRCSKYSVPGFDSSVGEMYPALLRGGAVYMIPKEMRLDFDRMNRYFEAEGITVCFLPTQACELFMTRENTSLRWLFTGGEKLKSYVPRQYRLSDNYGPTENSVVTTEFDVDRAYVNSPIGKPIFNTRVYILDAYDRLQPIGVAGELCISGEGLARGYWQRPELTAERFVPNPHEPGERMYRTGDLARWLPDGNVEFLGRMDHQVKIRGFRVETGEIEALLLNHEAVLDTVVQAWDEPDGRGKYLAGYLVWKAEPVPVSALREYLATQVPDYMIPVQWVVMESLPLSPNGKVDRKALPVPERAAEREKSYAAPGTPTEMRLAAIWSHLLQPDSIGIDDNFFALGGHSLKATTLTARVRKEFAVEIPLREFFAHPTIRELAQLIEAAAPGVYDAIQPVEPRDDYPVSSAQKRIYIMNQMNPAGTHYNIPTAMLIKGPLDPNRLREAIHRLVLRHESLRTSFTLKDGEPVQVVHDDADVIPELLTVAEQEWEEDGFGYRLIASLVKPFDLAEAPLFRVRLIQWREDRHLLFFDLHHIIADGVSVQILFRECMAYYAGRELPPVRLQYKGYSVWQRAFYASEKMAEEKEFWLRQFADGVPDLHLPLDYPRPRMMEFAGDRVQVTVNRGLTAELMRLCAEEETTLYMALLGLYALLMARYSGDEDVVIGSPIAGRPHADLEGIIGMFINTLAMRQFPSGEKSFLQYLREVKERTLQALDHQDYPFDELVEQLLPDRDQSRNPLFDVMFNFQELSQGEASGRMEAGGLTVESFSFANPIAKFDIAFPAMLVDGEIRGAFEYRTHLFKRSTIEQMAGHFLRLLEAAVTDPSRPMAGLEMLAPEEKERLVYGLNDTATPYPRDKTVTEIFEETAARVPDAPACIVADRQLTYRELNIRANRLARRLRSSGIGRGTIVGLMTHRSIEMIVGIMGIIKAGGAYLPIDPAYPAERIRYMLEESASPVLLTLRALADAMSWGLEPVILDDPALYRGEEENPPRINEPADLLYVIYTSGTTGNPKGVMIDHRSVLNLRAGLWECVYGRYAGHLRVTMLAAYVFDASVKQVFAALLLGHALCVVPEEARTDGQRLLQFYRDTAIDISDGTPAHLSILIQAMEAGTPMPVKHFVIGGEALPRRVVKEFLALCAEPKPRITNIYGPAECCVDTTAFLVEEENLPEPQTIPIGSPLANKAVYILDRSRYPVPAGVTGEMYISGEGISEGYLHAPELTEMKFLPDPFVPGWRMYKTGDLARRLADGQIEFIGRVDHQVKIRGYRIELGDITAKLLEHPQVHDAVVLDRADDMGEKYLCAYLVAAPEITGALLREYLMQKLPEYMVPARYLLLEAIPLTINGKVDRRTLLQMETAPVTDTRYAAPRTELEEQLVRLWEKVLRVEGIGIHDNFFALGGHSLKATTLVTRVKKEFDVKIALREFFMHPTVAELAQAVMREKTGVYNAIEPAEVREDYPVSSAQKRIYILNQFNPQGTHYNIPAVMMMEGPLDPVRFAEVIRKITERHESLRTSFVLRDGEPRQIIHPKIETAVEVSEMPRGAEEAVWAREAIARMIRPFDLTQAPLFRVGLIRLEEDRRLLFFDLHHIISDGISMQILYRECVELYSGMQLVPLRIQYKDFAVWQSELFASGAMKEEEVFWLKEFADEVPALRLPADYPRPRVMSFAGDVVGCNVGPELTNRLIRLAEAEGATLFMLLLAAYSLFLAKYSGEEDIVIGSPIAGREHADLEGIIGMFVNTLALRNVPSGEKRFHTYVREVKDRTLQALEHQNYPFDELVDRLRLERDQSRNPLFDVMFSYQEGVGSKTAGEGGFRFEPYEYTAPIAKFDITVSAVLIRERIEMGFEYRTSLFRRGTMERMLEHWMHLLGEVAENPNRRLREIPLLSEKERHRLLVEWNRTQAEYPADKTIVDLVCEQAARGGERVALSCKDTVLTYRELDRMTARLAGVLRQRGVTVEEPVALMVESSAEMIIGILGILKAGGVYVPIDPAYPEERIHYILTDCGARYCLTQTHLRERAAFAGECIVQKDGAWWDGEALPADPVRERAGRNPALMADHLAYIIYTSGSTGQPKGVMVEHKALVNLTLWVVREYELTEADRCTQYAGMSFDASIMEIFPCLAAGAALYPVPRELRLDLDGLNDYLHRHGITVCFLPTPVCEQFLTRENHSLRVLSTGGDQLKQYIPHAYRLINNYGPTENTVITSFSEVTPADEVISIGRPIANNQIYVLDRYDQPVPEGVTGELCVSGDGLARGYWNRPDLTAERFVDHPFIPGARMYRTGDLASLRPDGQLLFFGRMDGQVKIRGNRIELGEIEYHLLRHETIREAAVLARTDARGEKYICAYLVWKTDGEAEAVQEYLARRLPVYMIPARFVVLNAMPLTPNGKIDRRALPEPDVNPERTEVYVAPGDPIEEKLARIWSELLGVKEISVHDHFFELGGHSLKATALMAQVKKEFEADLALQEIFAHPTIAGLARVIREAKHSAFIAIEPAGEREYYPVSSAQKRMFILHQFAPHEVHYNIPLAMLVEGKWNTERFEQAVQSLVQRHGSLRTSFELRDGEPVQKVHPELRAAVTEHWISEKEAAGRNLEERVRSLIRPFDLSEAPLFRVHVLRWPEERCLLFFDLHHIIADGVSMQILFRECMELYAGGEVKPLRIQYTDYAVWQEELFRSGKMKETEEYWLTQFADGIPSLPLPTDEPRPPMLEYAGARIAFTVDAELTGRLLRRAEEEGATVFMTLLAAYTALLAKYTGEEDIVVGIPVAGRPHADLADVIGMFVNTLALRSQPSGEGSFRELLRQVRERSIAAFANQEYPFEMLVDRLRIERDQSHNPLFDTVFSYQEMSRGKENAEAGSRERSFTPLAYRSTVAKFDLTFSAALEQGELRCGFEYRTRLFREATIARMARHLRHLLAEFIDHPNRPLKAISLLCEAEQTQLLEDFNSACAPLGAGKTMAGLFHERVLATPDALAICDDGQELTYGEFDAVASGLARELMERGTGPDRPVGIVADSSMELMVGMMAILKAGGAYVPIDPAYPEERIRYILRDCGANLLLIKAALGERVSFDGEIFLLDKREWKSAASGSRISAEDGGLVCHPELTPEHLAYLIYTSGSTGTPKGVMVEHHSLVNMALWFVRYNQLTAEDRRSQYAGVSFDAALCEIFPTWIAGASLFPVPSSVRHDLDRLNAFFETHRITDAFLPTPVCELFLQKENHSLRNLHAGGDQIKQYRPHSYRLTNNYGPTENTCITTVYLVDQMKSLIPIGKPVENNQIYIVDRHDRLVPVGVTGELCIGGEQLARGYWNRPELTAASFVPNPFMPGTRMYRTGDLARWLPDGNLEYYGRKDYQVKIRGFRVEPGEIESWILRYEPVREAAVLAREEHGGGKYLCAYIVWKTGDEVEHLRTFLTERLPEYMIPTQMITLETMPLTPNGKVDRRALPAPEHIREARNYVPSRDPVEARLAAIWSELLGIGQVGIFDRFFELGGHSLKATTLMARIRAEFRTELSLQEIFSHPTISGLADVIREAGQTEVETIPVAEAREYYPVSSAQKRMFILHQFEPNGLQYNIPLVMLVEGKWDHARFERAVQELVQRHGVLRTCFVLVNGEPMQKVYPEWPIRVEEYRVAEGEASEEQLEEMIASMVRPFDLLKAPLFRVGVIRLAAEKCLLFFDVHHIIADGVSLSILFRECMRLYAGQTLRPLGIQYTDYAVWQEQFMASEELKTMEQFWLDRFADGIPTLQLPTDYPRPRVMEHAGGHWTFAVDEELTEDLLRLAEEEQVTVFMILLAAYTAFLAKYAGAEDIVVGTPIAGRPHAELTGLIGMFVNTLALRSRPTGEKTFRVFLREVRESTLQAFAYQEYPFEMLVDRLHVERDQSRNPVFDTVFSYQEQGRGKEEREGTGELTFTPWRHAPAVAKFDLTLSAALTGGRIECGLEFRTRLFRRETAERMSRHFVKLLAEVAAGPNLPLRAVSLLSEEERAELLVNFNAAGSWTETDETVVELFHEQVMKTPEAPAVCADGQCLTYRELERRAGALAFVLMKRGVGPDRPVGLLTESSRELIVGIMAILKAGGAYVPIDPAYPDERIRYILNDCGAGILLTRSMYAERVRFGGEMILLDTDEWTGNATSPGEREPADGGEENTVVIPAVKGSFFSHPLLTGDHLAYLIYTSGSTGEPKGVMVEHHSLAAFALWFKEYYRITPEDRWTQYAGVSFDASLSEIFPALVSGAAIYPVPSGVRYDLNLLNEFFERNGITLGFLPTPVCEQFMQMENRSLRYLTTGGDQLKQFIPRNYILTNNYGPTECTCIAAVFPVDGLYATIPIGKPVVRSQIYILDPYDQPVSVGVAGELCIAGRQLARGYWNRPDLTAERFVPNPFAPGTRMYRTGDLARWLPDGNLEYLGRKDQQVKIRGYRIEPGEIESHLLRHPAVREVTVIARSEGQNGEKYLCAYVVPHDSDILFDQTKAEEQMQEWKRYVKAALPEYMVPAHIMLMTDLPLTANGKVDRKALPEPQKMGVSGDFAAPETELEQRLAAIWKELLGLDTVSIHADFFAMGGHSLKATILANRIADALGTAVPLSAIFDHPTIAQLARQLEPAVSPAETRGSDTPNMVLLRRGEDAGRHVFLIHGGDGDVGIYRQLVACLPPRYQYWGLRSGRYTEEEADELSVAAVARAYRAQMERIQPRGPYHLISWCIGGTIAFEIVRQLEAEGREMGLCILLDTPAPHAEAMFIRSDADSTWNQIRRYRSEGTADAGELKGLIPAHIARTIPGFDRIGMDEMMAYLHTIRTLDRIRNQYRPDGRVASLIRFIAAEERGQDGTRWSRFTDTPVQTETVPGDHFTMLTVPGVLPTARVISAYLQTSGTVQKQGKE